VNASPEPFTNWAASFTEDALVLGGTWLAIAHPVVFLAFFAVFVVLLAWLLPRLWRFVAGLFRHASAALGGRAR
jgi:ABC-type multidrug transport system permease subunit